MKRLYGYPTILREPDRVFGASEDSPFRFEERVNWTESAVQYTYEPCGNAWRVVIHPGKAPVKYLKLRWRGDFSRVEAVLGDEWGRASATYAPVEWRSVMPNRILPWFCLLRAGDSLLCYGVKTGCDCFAYFQIDTHGVTLFLNLTCGADGTDVKESFTACEVTETESRADETVYRTARRFMGMLCEKPALPKAPVFGENNWYWAYGNISEEIVLQEADYLLEMTSGVTHRPALVIDDGWQINRNAPYIGGPFDRANGRFPDMEALAGRLRQKELRPGIWFRPLLTKEALPENVLLREFACGMVMDPSHPYTLERVRRDAARLRGWGFELLKHDFSTNDAFGNNGVNTRACALDFVSDGKSFYDNTKTTATILKNLYRAIQSGAGDGDVIGCSTIGHLAAGIHSIQRVGADTSGRCFEWTVRNGVHSFMRLPMNSTFFRIDPDCAAFTDRVPAEMNLRFLELCAVTGSVTLASVTPGSLTEAELREINRIYRIADAGIRQDEIVNYERTCVPNLFCDGNGAVRDYNWEETYDGSRSSLRWTE